MGINSFSLISEMIDSKAASMGNPEVVHVWCYTERWATGMRIGFWEVGCQERDLEEEFT